MTTHLVKSYKEPIMEEMQGMLKLLVEDHKRREEEVAAERMKREAEFEKERTRLKERGKDESEGQKNRWSELHAHLESIVLNSCSFFLSRVIL